MTTGKEARTEAAVREQLKSKEDAAVASPSGPAVPPWASLASGAASGLASCMLLQPMDLLKTRMQQQQTFYSGADAQRSRGGPKRRTQRLVRVARDVVQQDGWQGLWRGTVPTVARNVPGVALYFYSVSEIRALLSRSHIPILSLPQAETAFGGNVTRSKSIKASSGEKGNASTLARLSVAGNLLSGAVARVAVGFLLSPITVVKARFESSHFSKQAYPSLTRALREIYQSSGTRGLFRGFSATALRDAPYAGLYLAIYEKSKDGLARLSIVDGDASRGQFEQTRASSTVVSASGLIAGTFATLLTHPFDILKTRMQTMPLAHETIMHAPTTPSAASTNTSVGSAAHGSGAVRLSLGSSSVAGGAGTTPLSLIGMMRYIAQTDGMGAYLDGLGLRCARKAASSAIGWTIFEGGRGIWVRQHQRKQDAAAAAVLAKQEFVATSSS